MKKTHSVSSLKKWLLSFFLLAIIILIPQHSLQGYADEPKVFELDLGGKVHKLEAKANGETKQIENNITWDEKSKTLSFSNYNGTYISFKGSQPFYKDNITFHFTGENRLVGRTGNKPEDFGASLITYFPTTLTGAPGSKLVIAPTDPSQTHVNHGISGESSVSIGGDLSLDIKGISNSALWGISSLGTLRIQGNSNVSIDIFSKENRGVYGFAHGLSGNSIIISTTGRIQVRSASNGAYAFGIAADNVSIHNGDIDIEIPSATEGTHYAKAIRLNNDEGVLTLGGNMVSIVGSFENKIYGGSDPYSASVHVRYLRKGLLADHAEIRFASGDNGKLSTTPAYTIPKGSKWDSNYLAIPTPIPNKGYIFDRWEPALPSDGSTIDKNMTFTALFKKDENYSSTAEIRFIAGVNGELKGNTTFKVEKGTKWEDAKITIPGGYPAKGYHFAGWSPRLPYRNDLIEESMVYTAQFKTRIQYPTPVYIYFYEGSHGKLNGKDHFEGDSGTAWAAIVSEVPKVIPEVGYKFIGWNTPIPDPHSGVTSSLSFDAQYEEDPRSVPIQIDFSSTDGGTLDGALYNTINKGTKWKDSGIKVPNITSDPGYKFAGWKPDLPGPEDVLLESTGFVAQFVKEDVKPQQVTVTFAAGEHGKLNGTTTHTVNKDTLWSKISVPTPQADPGYKFDKWTPALPQATDKITGSKTYTANFVKEDVKPQQVTVTFATGEHGKLNGTTTHTVNKDTLWSKISVPTPQANSGYRFDKWTPALPQATDKITGSKTYTANFVKIPVEKVTVTFTAGANGSLIGDKTATVDKGTLWSSIQVPTPQPTQGFRFVGWNPALPAGNTAITKSQNYVASFEKIPAEKVTVTFASDANGKLAGNTNFTVDKGSAWSGITVPIPQPNQGYKFDKWTPALPQATDQITGSRTYTAIFVKEDVKPQQVTVTFAAGEHGKLTGSTTHTVNKDTLWSGITVPIPQPNQGYKFDKWTPALPQASDKITESKTYIAHFIKENTTPNTVKVTFVAGANGKLEGRTTFDVPKGTAFGTTLTPPRPKADAGFKFKGWSPNLPDSTFRINDNMTFTALFEADPKAQVVYTITFRPGNGSGAEFTRTVNKGQSMTLPNNSFSAPSGYTFDGWSVNGTKLNAGAQHLFTQDSIVTALWKAVPNSNNTGNSNSSSRSPVRPDKTTTIEDQKTPLAGAPQIIAILKIGSKQYQVFENNQMVPKMMDVPPMLHRSRTMLPARLIAELLGIEVRFDNAAKSAKFIYKTTDSGKETENIVQLTLGQKNMKVNGVDMPLSADILNVNGRILMPITDVQKALKELGLRVDVKWKHETKEVILEKTT